MEKMCLKDLTAKYVWNTGQIISKTSKKMEELDFALMRQEVAK